MDPTCAKDTFPTPLHHNHQPELLTQGSLGPINSCFWHQMLSPSSLCHNRNIRLIGLVWFIRQDGVFPICNCQVLVSMCPLQHQFSVLDFVAFCCCRPSNSRFNVLGMKRCFSAHHSRKKCYCCCFCCCRTLSYCWIFFFVCLFSCTILGKF